VGGGKKGGGGEVKGSRVRVSGLIGGGEVVQGTGNGMERRGERGEGAR